MSGKLLVTITVPMDEAKLDAYVRKLYDPDETVPGEPQPGEQLLKDWIAEAHGNIDAGRGSIDTLWFEPDNDYVDSVKIEWKRVGEES